MTESFQCLQCEHYHLDFKCDAFPDRIPEAIFNGDVDHRKPYPGDNGIQFSPIPGMDIEEEDDSISDAKKSIMPPSALDRLPYLNFNIEKKEKARDYAQEYRDYHGKPEQIKERAQRNAARRKLGLKRGDGKEADHKNPISNGGSNNSNNLRAVSRDTNRKKGASTK